MGKFEISAYQRKIQRERGEYRPEIPPFTKSERPQAQQALRIQKAYTSAAASRQAPELASVGSFLGNTLNKTGNHHLKGSLHHDGTTCDGQDFQEFSPGGMAENKSPIQRFYQKMSEHTESSRRDDKNRYRNCCR